MTFKLRGYAVERLLGRGGSGEVWQARVASSGAAVALKRIPAVGDQQRAAARAEAALLSALDHPNLVRLHGMVPTPDALVLVLDLADGGSLADLLAARGRLTPGEVITAIAPVAAALAYLHGEGVVHGDVSPGNILFSADGRPLLADVGVARLTGDDSDAAATPGYVDPGVAAGCIPGPSSDVFMLGAVALHALTAAPAWMADDAAAALELAAHGRLEDVPLRLAAASVPPAMAAVVARALALDPPRRGTAADLALDLRHSAEPVAVELAAGRGRPDPVPVVRSGPRHAARPVVADGPAGVEQTVGAQRRVAVPSAPARPADPSRPAFVRPRDLEVGGADPPTRLVQPRPRPVIPRPAPRPRVSRALAGLVAALLAAAAVLGVMWWRTGPSTASRARPRADIETLPPTSAATIGGAGATAAAHPAAGAGGTSDGGGRGAAANTATAAAARADPAHQWLAELTALDAVRARAFATRDASLLSRVYVRGPLLDTDAALLARIVPPRCGLSGARTAYVGVSVRDRGDGATMTVTATLPPSQLVCGGRTRATAPGAGPTRLRLELRRTGQGVRIAGERLVTA